MQHSCQMIAMKDEVGSGNENKTQKALAFSLSESTPPHPSVKSAPSGKREREKKAARALARASFARKNGCVYYARICSCLKCGASKSTKVQSRRWRVLERAI
jgi:hypothetical protein